MNSQTKIEIEKATKIGCTIFCLAIYINVNAIKKPKSKLPLSPKNNLGNLNIERLKHKKISIGIKIVIKNNLTLSLCIKNNKIDKVEIVAKPSMPSKPSK